MKIDFEYPSDESRHEDMEYDPTSDHTSDSSDFTESEEIDLEELVINFLVKLEKTRAHFSPLYSPWAINILPS